MSSPNYLPSDLLLDMLDPLPVFPVQRRLRNLGQLHAGELPVLEVAAVAPTGDSVGQREGRGELGSC